MTLETLLLLQQLLNAQQLNTGAPDFAQVATMVVAAQAELAVAIAEAGETPNANQNQDNQ